MKEKDKSYLSIVSLVFLLIALFGMTIDYLFFEISIPKLIYAIIFFIVSLILAIISYKKNKGKLERVLIIINIVFIICCTTQCVIKLIDVINYVKSGGLGRDWYGN